MTWGWEWSKCQRKLLTSFMDDPWWHSIVQCNSNSSAIRKKKIDMSVKVLENDTLNSSSFDSLFKEIIINEKLSDAAMRKKKIETQPRRGGVFFQKAYREFLCRHESSGEFDLRLPPSFYWSLQHQLQKWLQFFLVFSFFKLVSDLALECSRLRFFKGSRYILKFSASVLFIICSVFWVF